MKRAFVCTEVNLYTRLHSAVKNVDSYRNKFCKIKTCKAVKQNQIEVDEHRIITQQTLGRSVDNK